MRIALLGRNNNGLGVAVCVESHDPPNSNLVVTEAFACFVAKAEVCQVVKRSILGIKTYTDAHCGTIPQSGWQPDELIRAMKETIQECGRRRNIYPQFQDWW